MGGRRTAMIADGRRRRRRVDVVVDGSIVFRVCYRMCASGDVCIIFMGLLIISW
jgi:hypothetical protein